MKEFDYQRDFSQIDFRKHPEQYQVGRGEQGVLMVEPYKSEILPHWRFKTPELAEISANAIMALFEAYRRSDDFVGMDMARKFIQMGYTRARRYANHKGGRKYDAQGEILPYQLNEEKAAAAAIFKAHWDSIRQDKDYLARRKNINSSSAKPLCRRVRGARPG
ncbi:DUF4385 domain-containing protein [Erwinia aphidicola]